MAKCKALTGSAVKGLNDTICAQPIETFFALIGYTSLQAVHLRLHATYNALTLTRLVTVRDADDDDHSEKYAGRRGHTDCERQRREEPVGRLRQLQLTDIIRRVADAHLQQVT